MSTYLSARDSVTGGTSTSLDGINTTALPAGVIVLVVDTSARRALMYGFDPSSTATADGLVVVAPITGPGRWIQGQIGWLDDVGGVFMHTNLVKEPKLLPWFVGAESIFGPGAVVDEYPIQTRWRSIVAPLSSSPSWALIDVPGAVSQVAVNDAYVTVADITGGGVLTNLFLPGFESPGNVSTVRLTIDTVVSTLAFTSGSATDRFVFGDCRMQSPIGYSDTDVFPNGISCWTGSDIVGGVATRLYSTGSGRIVVMNPASGLNGAGRNLRFEKSLKVEMKTSTVSTTNFRHYCGAVYYLHP